MRAWKPALAALLVLLPGCLGGTDSPPPTLAARPTGVALLPLPSEGSYGGTVAVAWRIDNPFRAPVGETALRYGPAPIRDAALASSAYPFENAASAPDRGAGNVTALLALNLGTVYLRAYVEIGGRPYWSPEARIVVRGAPFGDPEVGLALPAAAEAGVPALATWIVANVTRGEARLSFAPANGPVADGGAHVVPLDLASNRTRAALSRPLVFPYPGGWNVTATIVVSGAVVAANATRIEVREASAANLAFIAPPRHAGPGERVDVRWRVNGPADPDSTWLRAGSESVAARALGARNHSASFFAPTGGNLTLRLAAVVGGAHHESAPHPVAIAPGGRGTYAVTLVNYRNATLPDASIMVQFRVTGPAANATFAGLHAGNRSVAEPDISPANYTGTTTPADGAAPLGGWRLPGAFFANLTAPPEPGPLHFRARVVVAGLAYWSDEGVVLVESP